jgi:hypothetical protein
MGTGPTGKLGTNLPVGPVPVDYLANKFVIKSTKKYEYLHFFKKMLAMDFTL